MIVSPPGDYYRGPPGEPDQDPDEDWVRNLQEEGRAYQEWDEDADIDESGDSSFSFSETGLLRSEQKCLCCSDCVSCAEESCEDSLAISAVRKEKKLLNGMIQNLLPAMGSSVRTLSLAYSAAVSSKMVRRNFELVGRLSCVQT